MEEPGCLFAHGLFRRTGETGPVTADSGVLLVGATHTFAETPTPDVILVPGGPGSMEHARDERVLEWLRRAHQTSTWTTSVCTGSVLLAAAGLLEGRRATTHWSSLPILRTFGATPVGDERIVREGKIVTAAGVSAGLDMALWLAGEIGGEARAKAEGEALLAQLRDGAASGKDWKVVEAATRSQEGVEPEVLQALFRMAKPEGDKPSYAGVSLQNGDFVLIRLQGVGVPKEALSAEDKALYRRYLASRAGQVDFAAYRRALDAKAEIKHL